MGIVVRKEGKNLYSAHVRFIFPDLNEKYEKETWESPRPVTWQELSRQLRDIGCDPVDMAEALHASDPDVRKTGKISR